YPGALSYGASTAIFGMIGVLFGNSMRKNRYSPGLPIDMSAMSKNIVIWVVISLLPGISFWGHLGGVIGGLVLGYLFETENSFKDDGFVEKSVIILYNVMLVLTVVSFIALFVSWFN
ncbi:rhomboid family intramembrane serine protease, partial [Candidatus Dojkabacteria bacterium]|nr:rhomboid family intramembrane serine protease [Candidatus Dojkabacteria bacterium]